MTPKDRAAGRGRHVWSDRYVCTSLKDRNQRASRGMALRTPSSQAIRL